MKPDPIYPHQSKYSGMRWMLVLVSFPLLYAVGLVLPVSLGWENGPIEMAQNGLLVLAILMSLGMAHTRRTQGALWLAFALIWFVLLGRELSWGAVWAEPLSRTPEGEPFYSSRVLFYRPYVPAILGVVSGTIALLLWRSGLKNLLRDGWWCKRSQFPWLSVCAMLVYGVMSWLIEHLPLEWQPWVLRGQAQVLEELFETMVYGFAGSAQWHAFRHWLKPD